MKILLLSYEFPPLGGGGGAVVRDLAAELVRIGHAVDVVTMRFKGLAKQEEIEGVRVFRVPSFRRKMATCNAPEMFSYLLGAAPFLLKLTRQEHYDVVHCHFAIPTGPLAVFLKWRRKLPFVLTCHGGDIPGYNPDRFKLAHYFTKPPLRFILSRAGRVTSPSRFLKGLIEQQLGDYGVEVIPNGIDVAKIAPGQKKNIILMTGRLLPRKGFQHVLQALEGVESGFEAHIAGDGPMMDELKAIASRLKTRVVFHGWIPNDSDELRQLYEEALIYCLPSAKENASIALLEAMLCGAAVLTSDVSGCPETLGECGAKVSPGDVEGIRKVLTEWIANPDQAAEIGRRARQRALDHYAWPDIAGQFVELYERVIGQGA